MRTLPLDSKFWSRFAKQFWERKSIVVKNIGSGILELSDSEVFKLLVAASDISRQERSPLGFKFYVQGIRSSDYEAMFVLPKRSDKSLLGYHQRMERVYQDYCLVCDELLQVNQSKQALLNQFTRDLFQEVGFPNRFVEMGLYLGNYKKTPFGVHVDRCGVFSFPVIGTKKFRTWTSRYVEKNPDLEQSFRYSKHKAKSKLLIVQPGDMAYWPSSEWHIAESDGNFSATWSLGVWVDEPTRDKIARTLTTLLASKIGSAFNEPTVSFRKTYAEDGEVKELPEVFNQAAATIKSLLDAELKESFLESWMSRLSGHGMKTLPHVDENIRMGKAISLRHHDSPILWTLVGRPTKASFKFKYSFAGSEPQTSTSKPLLKLIKDLNLGKTCELKRYFRKASSEADFRIIKHLASLGAVTNSMA